MKKIHTMNIEEGVYKEFKMYALMIDKSVSALIEEYMKNVLKEKQKWEKGE